MEKRASVKGGVDCMFGGCGGERRGRGAREGGNTRRERAEGEEAGGRE